ncbi:hypothetical protein L1080_033675 [Rhodococcus sp. MSC1_016]|uniref:hypothetical protein n=1 Tax=Rhodococcus sp. MSC1_016 TaxID=2909266 RepID=UPI00202E2BA6|nr:hypothetical protein [Rhodococcus sp. MSC1_016]
MPRWHIAFPAVGVRPLDQRGAGNSSVRDLGSPVVLVLGAQRGVLGGLGQAA